LADPGGFEKGKVFDPGESQSLYRPIRPLWRQSQRTAVGNPALPKANSHEGKPLLFSTGLPALSKQAAKPIWPRVSGGHGGGAITAPVPPPAVNPLAAPAAGRCGTGWKAWATNIWWAGPTLHNLVAQIGNLGHHEFHRPKLQLADAGSLWGTGIILFWYPGLRRTAKRPGGGAPAECGRD
jgi:hypothetical protein